jgi:hypothetical protein
MPPPIPPDNAPVFRRKLSDAFIRSLTEPGKHGDGDVPGLYLGVRASSKAGKPPSKFWRLKYRLHGKENRFSIGAYPDIGLKEARDIARGARRDVANHIAPLKAKTAKIEAQLLNEERTFEYVAKQWLTFKSAELVTKSISGFSGALSNLVYRGDSKTTSPDRTPLQISNTAKAASPSRLCRIPETSVRYCSPTGVSVTSLAVLKNNSRPIITSSLAS